MEVALEWERAAETARVVARQLVAVVAVAVALVVAVQFAVVELAVARPSHNNIHFGRSTFATVVANRFRFPY